MTTSIKEMRGYFRSEAKRAKAFEDLEAKFKEFGDLERIISNLKDAKGNAERGLEGVRANTVLAQAENARLCLQAGNDAREMKDAADKLRQDAKERAASATEIVADAKAEAAAILRQGRVDADQLVKGNAGALADVLARIKAAEERYSGIEDEVQQLENHRDDVSTEIDALRNRLG